MTENEEKLTADTESEKRLEEAGEYAFSREVDYMSALNGMMNMDEMFSAAFAGMDDSGEYGARLDENDEEFKAFAQFFRAPEIDFSAFDFGETESDGFCEDGELAADVAKALGLM